MNQEKYHSSLKFRCFFTKHLEQNTSFITSRLTDFNLLMLYRNTWTGHTEICVRISHTLITEQHTNDSRIL